MQSKADNSLLPSLEEVAALALLANEDGKAKSQSDREHDRVERQFTQAQRALLMERIRQVRQVIRLVMREILLANSRQSLVPTVTKRLKGMVAGKMRQGIAAVGRLRGILARLTAESAALGGPPASRPGPQIDFSSDD